MLPDEIRKKIKKLRIISYHKATDLMAGFYHSAFKGQGLEFEEVREYQLGDDIRNIDWNVTAKSGKPFVKLFREERELTVFFLIDVSASTFYGLNGLKKDFIAEISAVLSFSAITNNDKVGLILFSDKIEKYIPPKKGRQAAIRVLREILSFDSHRGKTDIKAALDFYSKVHRKKGIVFLLSDFLASNFEKELALLSTRKDVIGVMVKDDLEKCPPDMGIVPVQDLETSQWILTDLSHKKVRSKIAANFNKHNDRVKRMFHRLGLDFLSLDNGEDYLKKLLQLFRRREKRL